MKAFSRPTLAQGEGQRFRFGEYPGPSGRAGQFFAQARPSRWAKFGGRTPERSNTKDLRRIALGLHNERREQNVSNYSGVDALASRRPAPRSGAGFVAADGRRPLLRLAVWFATTCCCGLAKRIGRPSKECSASPAARAAAPRRSPAKTRGDTTPTVKQSRRRARWINCSGYPVA